MYQAILKHGWLLGIFALVTAGLIALTHSLTKERIALQEQRLVLSTLNKIIPPELYNNELSRDCVVVTHPLLGQYPARLYRARQDNSPVALAVEVVTPDGYSGNIKLLTALLTQDTIGGARVLSHKETPGLGDKIDERISDWINSFQQLSASQVTQTLWAVKKDGGQFDQFTGATITPRSVVDAVGKGVNFMQQHWQQAFVLEPNSAELGSNDNAALNVRECGASK